MTTGTYTPAVLPTKLIANLVDSYWDTKGGSVPKPMILEKPAPAYQRVDTLNMVDNIIFSMLLFVNDNLNNPLHMSSACEKSPLIFS